jgi:hypothetical protein
MKKTCSFLFLKAQLMQFGSVLQDLVLCAINPRSFRLEIRKIKIQELAMNEGNSSHTNLIISSSIERSLGVFLQNWEGNRRFSSKAKKNKS